MLDESDVRLDQAWLDLVVAQSGARIESTDVLQRRLNGFDRTADRLGDFFVLLVLHRAQMLVDDRNRVGKNLARCRFRSFCCELRPDGSASW